MSVKGVLRSASGEVVLLLNERDGCALGGGRIELVETSAECLARELREELNVDPRVGLPTDSHPFEVVPAMHVYIATYCCIVSGPFEPRLSDEHKRMGLFAPSALAANLSHGHRSSIEVSLTIP